MPTPGSQEQAGFPLAQTPFLNPDGTVARVWLYFLATLYQRTGGAQGGDGQITLADILSLEVTLTPLTADAVRERLADVVAPTLVADPRLMEIVLARINSPYPLCDMTVAPALASAKAVDIVSPPAMAATKINDVVFAPAQPTDYAQATHTVTLGASPATYTATSRQAAVLTGGTVSMLALQRGATSLALGAVPQIVELSPGDSLQVTYTAAPTFTILPR